MNNIYVIGYYILGSLLLLEVIILLVGYFMLQRKFGRFISKKAFEKNEFLRNLLEEPSPEKVYGFNNRNGFGIIMEEKLKWKHKETDEAQKQL